MSIIDEDGCTIDEGQVEWRDNSAAAYCRGQYPDGEAVDCWGPLESGKGVRAATDAAKVHALTTGHRCTVESSDIYITEVERIG